MKALVIGGTRFVGLRLVRLLASQGHDVTLLNRGRTQAQLPSGIKRLYADRRDPDAMRAVLQGQSFEVVYDMTGYQVINLEPVVEVLAGKIEHYVFQSTCGVYAESEVLPILEDFPYRPRMPEASGRAAYEQEKAECEQFLLQAYKERLFPATIFRCPLIYGPENWMDEREGSYFTRLLQGRKVLIPGNGATMNHFVHVDDVARAHVSVAGRTGTLGQVYNIAGPQAITINGYVDTIARVVGVEAQKVYLEPEVVRKLGRSIFPFTWERNSFYGLLKAKDHLAFRPQFDVYGGLEDTYQWWSRERGLEKIQFVPGKLGCDVDLAYEDKVLSKYG